MKAIKLLLASVVLAGAASLAFAGPSPEYWTRTKQAEKQQAKTKAEAQATVQAANQVKAPTETKIAATAPCSCAGMKKS